MSPPIFTCLPATLSRESMAPDNGACCPASLSLYYGVGALPFVRQKGAFSEGRAMSIIRESLARCSRVALPILGLCSFGLAVGNLNRDGTALATGLLATVFVVVSLVFVISCGVGRSVSEEFPIKLGRAFWVGFGLCSGMGTLVALELARKGRGLPSGMRWLELSPVMSKWFVMIGAVLTLIGTGLIVYDVIKYEIYLRSDEAKALAKQAGPRRRDGYWPVNRFVPELDGFQTDEQAGEALKRARSSLSKGWPFVGCVVLLILGGLAPLSALRFSDWGGCFIGPYCLMMGWPYIWLRRAALRRSIREELCKAGIPICIACGYDLRGKFRPVAPNAGMCLMRIWSAAHRASMSGWVGRRRVPCSSRRVSMFKAPFRRVRWTISPRSLSHPPETGRAIQSSSQPPSRQENQSPKSSPEPVQRARLANGLDVAPLISQHQNPTEFAAVCGRLHLLAAANGGAKQKWDINNK